MTVFHIHVGSERARRRHRLVLEPKTTADRRRHRERQRHNYGGSWIAPADLVAAGDWGAIEAKAREAAGLSG